MAMPKTSVDEYDFLASSKNQIGSPWQCLYMQAISVARPV